MESTEALLLDGANGVCSGPRHPNQWQTLPTLSIFFLSLIAMAIWSSLPAHRTRKILSIVLIGAFLISISLGFWTLTTVRADAPWRIGETARQLSSLNSAIEKIYQHRKVIAMADQCVECLPAIVFMQGGRWPLCHNIGTGNEKSCLVPPHRTWAVPEAKMLLMPNASHGQCQLSENQLVCGTME